MLLDATFTPTKSDPKKTGTGEFRNFEKAVVDYLTLIITAGLPPPSQEHLSLELHIHITTLRHTLDDLQRRRILKTEQRHSMRRFVLKDVGATAWSTPGRSLHGDVDKVALRSCLYCDKKFWSTHKGNRLCATHR